MVVTTLRRLLVRASSSHPPFYHKPGQLLTRTKAQVPVSTPHWPRTCYQTWRGTAPFCNGNCEPGEKVLGYNDVTSDCGKTTDETLVVCSGFTDNTCETGNYALCEIEC